MQLIHLQAFEGAANRAYTDTQIHITEIHINIYTYIHIQ